MSRNKKPGCNRAGGKGENQSQLNYSTERDSSIDVLVRRPDGRICGRTAGGALFKHCRCEYVLQRLRQAWAWDDCILEVAEDTGARFTEVECDGLIYWADLLDFRSYGFPVNHEHGAQHGLALAGGHIQRIGESPAAVQRGPCEATQ